MRTRMAYHCWLATTTVSHTYCRQYWIKQCLEFTSGNKSILWLLVAVNHSTVHDSNGKVHVNLVSFLREKDNFWESGRRCRNAGESWKIREGWRFCFFFVQPLYHWSIHKAQSSKMQLTI